MIDDRILLSRFMELKGEKIQELVGVKNYYNKPAKKYVLEIDEVVAGNIVYELKNNIYNDYVKGFEYNTCIFCVETDCDCDNCTYSLHHGVCRGSNKKYKPTNTYGKILHAIMVKYNFERTDDAMNKMASLLNNKFYRKIFQQAKKEATIIPRRKKKNEG